MSHVTSLSARVAALFSSALAHAGVAFTLLGHAPAAPRAAQTKAFDMEFSVASEPAPEVQVPVETAEKPASRGTPRAPHHRHPYPVRADHDAVDHSPDLVHLPAPTAPADPAPPVAAAPPASGLRFAMTVARSGASTASLTQAGAAPRTGQTSSNGEAQTEPASERSVDEPARRVFGRTPDYPLEARSAGVEADVSLEIVVDAQGRVVAARALSRAGFGLEEAALAGVRAFRFAPAKRGGRAVAVRMKWTVQFRFQ